MASKGASKVIDIDRGLGELRRTLKSLVGRGSYVKVGVLGMAAAEKHDEVTNVDLAIIQEFGAPKAGIPARSFIGGTFELEKANYEKLLAKGLAKVYENKFSVKQLLGLMGVKMTADIKKRVMSGSNFVPNAPDTIRRKMKKGEANRGGFIGPLAAPRPLIDTGRMVGSVTHEVVMTSDEQGKGFSKPVVTESEAPSSGHEE